MSIINPWIIYLLDVIEKIRFFLELLSLFGTGIIMAAVVSEQREKENIDKKVKFIKKILLIVAIGIIYSIFIPSKKTLLYMFVAKNITVENAQLGEKKIKETVDYIFEKIKEVK